MNTVLLSIEGMSCEGCVKRVRAAVEKAGAKASEVTVGSARVEFDETRVGAGDFVKAIEKIGFDVVEKKEGAL